MCECMPVRISLLAENLCTKKGLTSITRNTFQDTLQTVRLFEVICYMPLVHKLHT